MKEMIIPILISGIVSPIVVSVVVYFFIWTRQRKGEVKLEILKDASRALAQYHTDCLDINLQKSKPVTQNGLTRIAQTRKETDILMISSNALVRAFFSKESANKYDEAGRTEVLIEKATDPTFLEKYWDSIKAMADEV